MTEKMQMVPPHSVEAEYSVLGCMLLDKEAISEVSEILTADDFYLDSHKILFESILYLYDNGTPVDLVTIVDYLRDKKLLEDVGGITYITRLLNSVPTTANARYYAQIVENKSTLRKLIFAANDIIKNSYQASEEIEDILNLAEKHIFDISQKRNKGTFTHVKSVLLDNFSKIEKLYANQSKITGVPTGFIDIDNKTSGLQNSDLILVAARPSMGKTAFALNIAQYAAVQKKIPVAIFSLEMSKEQLVNRMLCAEANIDSHKLRSGDLDENDWIKLARAVAPLSEAPIYIDDTAGINVVEMRSKARRLKIEHDIQIIFIDYLQLMQGRGRAESRQQEISEISRSLKSLARELNIPIVALSQLSRAPESRNDHRPMLSDLRESGAIEQDADVVMFLYRDEYYNPDTELKNIGEVIIAKQRNGPTGTVKLVWLAQFTKFANLIEQEEI